MKIKKIGATKYEITETREDKYIIDIKTINDNIKMIEGRIKSRNQEIKRLKEQKVEQINFKETLLEK